MRQAAWPGPSTQLCICQLCGLSEGGSDGVTAVATRANASFHGVHCARVLSLAGLLRVFGPSYRPGSWVLPLPLAGRSLDPEELTCPELPVPSVSTSKAAALVGRPEGSSCCLCCRRPLFLADLASFSPTLSFVCGLPGLSGVCGVFLPGTGATTGTPECLSCGRFGPQSICDFIPCPCVSHGLHMQYRPSGRLNSLWP